ncbi:FAD-dependent oxidoreductase [Actinoplanes sp. NPDC023936]|uniref:FAD-dependent oxidoreductase n=1 Tax=Actinoplanes sp. NPDC023936 TaxID=3154910 RepID=UPI00340C4E33
MISRRSLLRAGGGVAALAAAPPLAGLGAEQPLLSAKTGGDVVLPADPRYATAKELHYAQWDTVNPKAIVYAQTPSDVQTVIRFAQDAGVPLHTRSGGHNFAGWSTGPGIVLDVSRIKHAVPGAETVRVGPGAQSVDALTALSAAQAQILTGTCPTVCPGGFYSGGGIGMQTRKFGIGSDRLTSATVVLADGRIVKTSSTSEPQLFWALRGGGGGNFGVVVDFEVRRINQPRAVYYNTQWAFADVREVLPAWQEWTATASPDLGSAMVIVLPDGMPEENTLVFVYGLHHGDQAQLDASLDRLQALAGRAPLNRFSTELPYAQAMLRIYGCDQISAQACHRVGTNPEASLHRGTFQRDAFRLVSRPFGAADVNRAIDTFVAGRHPGQSRVLNLMAVGGVANERYPSETAFAHRDAEWSIGYVATHADPAPSTADSEAATAWTNAGAAVLEPVATGAYVNFPSYHLPDWRQQYYADNFPRLVSAKRVYDRHNFFRHPRSIGS